MELELSSKDESSYLKKYLFNLKTHRNDGYYDNFNCYKVKMISIP